LLAEIKEILFPPLKLETITEKDGNTVKISIDYSVDCNLDAALYDLMEDSNDKVTQDTIRKVSERLFKVKQLLNANEVIHKEAQYLMVSNLESQEKEENLYTEEL
jgi:hypothetical protein